MLNYFLQHLVGPKMGALKVKDFSEFDFKPQQLVSDICTIYLNLGYVMGRAGPWGGRRHPGDTVASRGPWWAFWQHAVLFCNNLNVNDPRESDAAQVAGLEAKHCHGYVHTVSHSGEDLGEALHCRQAFL